MRINCARQPNGGFVVEIYTFRKDTGKKVTHDASDFVLTRMIQTKTEANIGCMYLERGGIVGYHQAKVPQLLLVIHGRALVRTEKTIDVEVEAGDAVFWKKDEWHESKTETGMTAIVLESETLDPSPYMPLVSRFD